MRKTYAGEASITKHQAYASYLKISLIEKMYHLQYLHVKHQDSFQKF